jgi:LysW-gamma-L-lysine carboxypeptidase
MNDIDLLEGLLRQYSPTLEEAGAVKYLVGAMAGLGYDAHVDAAGNAVGTRGSGPRELLMLGHIDTVPGEIDVRREGDLLYGRGAVDAKGPLACFACAGAQVQPPPGWRVTVIGAVGEEGASRGAKYLLGRTPPTALVIGEPSRWNRVTLGYKGSAWVGYGVKAAMAHTASRTESACEAAVRFWNSLQAWCSSYNEGREAAFEQVTSTLRGMSSGSDGFSETAALKFGMRLPPGLEPEDLLRQLEGMKGDGTIEMEEGIAACRADKNTPLARAFIGAIRAEGGTPGYVLKTGTSDMNLVAPIWNCPTLAYGPGDSSLDHTPHEHISVSEFEAGVRVLSAALERVMGE